MSAGLVILLGIAGAALLALPAAFLFTAFLFTAWTARKVEALLPPAGRFVDVDVDEAASTGAGSRTRTRLHVREAGPDGAPAVVMIHGLAGQSAHFSHGVMPRLAARLRMVALDRPGAGWSPRAAAAPADLRTQAAAVAALIERLGLERPLVVGHSLGGAVALALALDHPHRVGALALIAPLSHMQDAPPAVFRGLTIASPLLRRLVAWTLATPLSIRNARAALAQVFGPDPVPADFPTRGGGLLGLRPRAFLGASADLQALPDALPALEARYGELRLPLHILFGQDDRILDWRRNGQALAAEVPGARIRLTAGGHMLPVTHPELCADFIAQAAQAADAGAASTLTSACRL